MNHKFLPRKEEILHNIDTMKMSSRNVETSHGCEPFLKLRTGEPRLDRKLLKTSEKLCKNDENKYGAARQVYFYRIFHVLDRKSVV